MRNSEFFFTCIDSGTFFAPLENVLNAVVCCIFLFHKREKFVLSPAV